MLGVDVKYDVTLQYNYLWIIRIQKDLGPGQTVFVTFF